MSYPATVYRVFIASPSDVTEEREIVTKVIDDWNAAHSEKESIVLLPIRWETNAYPEMGAPAQEILNKQILKDADLLIGIFWGRLGTPTDKHLSGTVEEITEHINAGKPAMLYFCKRPLPPNVDTDQLNKLREFKDVCSKKGLLNEYTTPDEFRHTLLSHLSMRINKDGTFSPQLPSPPKTDAVALSKDAEEMLRTAIKYNTEIINIGHLAGRDIGPNGFTDDTSDPRMIAKLEAALEELEDKGFIKATSHQREVFTITHAGYGWCDSNKFSENNQ